MKIALKNWKCVLKAFNHQTVLSLLEQRYLTYLQSYFTSSFDILEQMPHIFTTKSEQLNMLEWSSIFHITPSVAIKCVPYNISQETVIAEQNHLKKIVTEQSYIHQLAEKLLGHCLLTMVCASSSYMIFLQRILVKLPSHWSRIVYKWLCAMYWSLFFDPQLLHQLYRELAALSPEPTFDDYWTVNCRAHKIDQSCHDKDGQSMSW